MVVKKSAAALNEAVKILLSGGVVICPTDTVYGFLADALNKEAIDKIYEIKKRSRSKPLPIFVRDFKMAKELAEINEKQGKIIKKYWPGKFTFVLCKAKPSTKLYGTEKNTVALRIPKHKFLNSLLKKINKPLVQTSVNISNNPSVIKIGEIVEQFDKSDILIIDGGNFKRNQPSKVIDLTNDKIKILRK